MTVVIILIYLYFVWQKACLHLGVEPSSWHNWHNVTKKLQEPVERVVRDEIQSNRERIRNEIPAGNLGSSQNVTINYYTFFFIPIFIYTHDSLFTIPSKTTDSWLQERWPCKTSLHVMWLRACNSFLVSWWRKRMVVGWFVDRLHSVPALHEPLLASAPKCLEFWLDISMLGTWQCVTRFHLRLIYMICVLYFCQMHTCAHTNTHAHMYAHSIMLLELY